MSHYVFSPSQNMFYPLALKADYERAQTWPVDGVEVDDAVYREFAAGDSPQGKVRIVGAKGLPEWGDLPQQGKEELTAQREIKKAQLIQTAAATIAPLQDAADLGIATEAETTQLLAWKKYRVLVSRVDTSIVEDTDWPVSPDV